MASIHRITVPQFPFKLDSRLSFSAAPSLPSGADKITDDQSWDPLASAGALTDDTDTTHGFSDVWTLMCWIKPAAPVGSAGFFSYLTDAVDSEDEITCRMNNGDLIIRCRDSAKSTIKSWTHTTAITDAAWNQVVVTFDGSAGGDPILFYVDGVDVTAGGSFATDTTGTMTDGNRHVTIGAFQNNESNLFDGQVYSAASWDVVLTPAAILEMYCAGDGQFDLNQTFGDYTVSANLQHWYRCGENTGSIGEDTGNGTARDANDGAAVSGDFSTDFPQP